MSAKDFGIVGNRTLTPEQQGQVRARCLALQMVGRHVVGEVNLAELRWDDTYTRLYVQQVDPLAGAMRSVKGLVGDIDEATQGHLIVNTRNPLARSILGAIEEVLTGGEYASSEARSFYGPSTT